MFSFAYPHEVRWLYTTDPQEERPLFPSKKRLPHSIQTKGDRSLNFEDESASSRFYLPICWFSTLRLKN